LKGRVLPSVPRISPRNLAARAARQQHFNTLKRQITPIKRNSCTGDHDEGMRRACGFGGALSSRLQRIGARRSKGGPSSTCVAGPDDETPSECLETAAVVTSARDRSADTGH